MIVCVHCGVPLPRSGALVCPNCGRLLFAPPEPPKPEPLPVEPPKPEKTNDS